MRLFILLLFILTSASGYAQCTLLQLDYKYPCSQKLYSSVSHRINLSKGELLKVGAEVGSIYKVSKSQFVYRLPGIINKGSVNFYIQYWLKGKLIKDTFNYQFVPFPKINFRFANSVSNDSVKADSARIGKLEISSSDQLYKKPIVLRSIIINHIPKRGEMPAPRRIDLLALEGKKIKRNTNLTSNRNRVNNTNPLPIPSGTRVCKYFIGQRYLGMGYIAHGDFIAFSKPVFYFGGNTLKLKTNYNYYIR